MNVKEKRIYSEVYQILETLGTEYIDKLPSKLYNMIKEKRDFDYNPQYVDDIPLNKQNVKKETISIIALLHLNYWCEDEQEKIEIKQILDKNEKKYQQEIREKYDPDKIFSTQIKNVVIENDNSKHELIIKEKTTFFTKILNKIKSMFNMNY